MYSGTKPKLLFVIFNFHWAPCDLYFEILFYAIFGALKLFIFLSDSNFFSFQTSHM